MSGKTLLATFMNALRTVERVLVAIILIAMSVLYFLNVVVRSASPKLATELAWIEEATLFAFAWLVFVGLGLALEQRRHIAMTVFLDSRQPRVAAVIYKMLNLAGLVFCLFLTKSSFELAVFIWNSGQISPTLGFSVVGLYAPLPVGFALLGPRYLLELLGIQDRSKIQYVAVD